MSLPSDLKSFRADPDRMRQLCVAVCATAALMLPITVLRANYDVQRERADQNERAAELAKHYASLVAACMNGDQWLYVDPHTGADMAVFCDVYDVRVGEWRKVP